MIIKCLFNMSRIECWHSADELKVINKQPQKPNLTSEFKIHFGSKGFDICTKLVSAQKLLLQVNTMSHYLTKSVVIFTIEFCWIEHIINLPTF